MRSRGEDLFWRAPGPRPRAVGGFSTRDGAAVPRRSFSMATTQRTCFYCSRPFLVIVCLLHVFPWDRFVFWRAPGPRPRAVGGFSTRDGSAVPRRSFSMATTQRVFFPLSCSSLVIVVLLHALPW